MKAPIDISLANLNLTSPVIYSQGAANPFETPESKKHGDGISPVKEEYIAVDVNPVYESLPPSTPAPDQAPETPGFQPVPFPPDDDEFDHDSVPKGLHVSFTNLTYSVNTGSMFRKVPYKILTNVSAHFQPGDMTALMGPSGCGKTTLLDVISGRKTSGTIEGVVHYGTSEASKSFLSRNTGYVEQFDTLVDNLTVREMLEYTAEMKLPHTKPKAEKKAAVEKIVAKLSLEKCCNTVIGNATQRGISGGQAKRVNIGVSIITDPLVLYLDEPTSGLDSFTSDEVMTFVKQLSDEGMTVCATIHSPSPYTFHLFKQLLLMVGGRIVYYGINGNQAVNYFMQSGLLPEGTEPPEYYQQAEFIISFVTDAGNKGKRDLLADAFLKSPHGKEVDLRSMSARSASLKRVHGMLTVEDLERDNPRRGQSTTVPRWYAIQVIFLYKALKNFKDGLFLSARIVDKFICGGIIMSLYNNIGGGSQEISSEKQFASVFFMWSTQPAFSAAGYIPTIMMERALYSREINDGLYDPLTYYVSKWIQEIIIAFPISIIFSAMIYGALAMSGNFGVFWFTFYLTQMTAIGVAFTFAALCPTIDFANGAVPSFGATLLFFVGFLIPLNEIPNWWVWYSYFDYLRYSNVAMMVNELKRYQNAFTCQETTFSSILSYYGMENQAVWWNMLALFGYWCFWALSAFACLVVIKWGSR